MKKCLNCDGSVTERYAAVFAPDGMETVRTCPQCELQREQGRIREPKNTGTFTQNE